MRTSNTRRPWAVSIRDETADTVTGWRTSVSSSGRSRPGRTIRSRTGVPGAPCISSTASTYGTPCRSWPPTAVTTSPRWMPAFDAGSPGSRPRTTRPRCTRASSTPTPANEPRSDSSSSWYAAGVRYSVYGSSSVRITPSTLWAE